MTKLTLHPPTSRTPQPSPITGRYVVLTHRGYGPSLGSGTFTGYGRQQVYLPLHLTEPIIADRFSMQVVTAGVAGGGGSCSVKMAIYATDAYGYPTGAPVKGLDAVAAQPLTSTGQINFDPAADIVLEPGAWAIGVAFQNGGVTWTTQPVLFTSTGIPSAITTTLPSQRSESWAKSMGSSDNLIDPAAGMTGGLAPLVWGRFA